MLWLKSHNHLYVDLPLDKSVMDLYPENDILPSLYESVVQDNTLDLQSTFNKETAGFSDHPATMLLDGNFTEPVTMAEKMDVSDPECDKISGHTFTAAALCSLIPASDAKRPTPDLIIYHGSSAVPEYNNPNFFPGMYLILFPYGIGECEIKRKTPLSFQQQAKFYFNIHDHAFRYHESYMFVVWNIMQHQAAHLQTHFPVKRSHFHSIAKKLTSVSSNVLQRLADQLEHERSYKDLDEEEKNALNLLKCVNTVASKIFTRNEIQNYHGYFG